MNTEALQLLAQRRTIQGFSLFELLLAVSLLALVVGLAAPTMTTMAERRQTIAAVERIYGEIKLARSSAVAMSQPMFLTISPGTDWAVALSDDATCDPSDNDPVCTIPDVDGNNAITNRFTFGDNDDVQVATDNNQITFFSQRGTATPTNITVTSTGDVGYIVNIIVRPLGQVSICSPITDPDRHLTSYRECA